MRMNWWAALKLLLFGLWMGTAIALGLAILGYLVMYLSQLGG